MSQHRLVGGHAPQLRARLLWMATTVVVLVAVVGGPTAAHPGGRRDGALDRSFGVGGSVATAFPSADGEIATALAAQADGKLVAAGTVSRSEEVPATSAFGLARYHRSGRLDRGFGTHGLVTTHFSAESVDSLEALVVQRDGKLVAAGRTWPDWGTAGTVPDFALARYNPDGSLDPTFGSGGLVTTDFGGSYDEASALAVQADGKLVAAGFTTTGEVSGSALTRYNPDGSLDPTFGSGGRVVLGTPATAVQALVVQADGMLVVTGGGFVTARLGPDGSLDPSFGSDGIVTPGVNGNADALAVQADGKLVAAGGVEYDFALLRFDDDGTLDTSFGRSGVVTTDFAGSVDGAYALVTQGDGKLIAGGVAMTPTDTADPRLNFGLARYDRAGRLDPRFGGDGTVITGFAGGGASINALILQADGKLVAAGVANSQSSSTSGGDFGLARYHTSSRHH